MRIYDALDTLKASNKQHTNTIREVFNTLPRVGQHIKVLYNCEYVGTCGIGSTNRKRIRTAVIVQKVIYKTTGFVVIEFEPDEIYKGRYRTSFLLSDLIEKTVKMGVAA